MPRQLRDLPLRQVREDAGRQLPALGAQACDLVGDVHLGIARHELQLVDLRLQLGDRRFEVQEIHGHSGAGAA
jgi:hypothetical protein